MSRSEHEPEQRRRRTIWTELLARERLLVLLLQSLYLRPLLVRLIERGLPRAAHNASN